MVVFHLHKELACELAESEAEVELSTFRAIARISEVLKDSMAASKLPDMVINDYEKVGKVGKVGSSVFKLVRHLTAYRLK